MHANRKSRFRAYLKFLPLRNRGRFLTRDSGQTSIDLTNPYAPPPLDADLTIDRSLTRKRVAGPATALIIMSSIHCVFIAIQLVTIAIAVVQGGGSGMPLFTTIFVMVQFAGQILIAIGAAKLGFLESYRMARMGAMLACVPFVTPFIWLGIPFGIWALRLLADPVVRNAFPDRLGPAIESGNDD